MKQKTPSKGVFLIIYKQNYFLLSSFGNKSTSFKRLSSAFFRSNTKSDSGISVIKATLAIKLFTVNSLHLIIVDRDSDCFEFSNNSFSLLSDTY